MILVVGSARRPLSLVSVRCTEGLRQVYPALELDGVSMDRDVARDLCRSRELDRRHTGLHLSQVSRESDERVDSGGRELMNDALNGIDRVDIFSASVGCTLTRRLSYKP